MGWGHPIFLYQLSVQSANKPSPDEGCTTGCGAPSFACDKYLCNMAETMTTVKRFVYFLSNPYSSGFGVFMSFVSTV